MGHDFFMGTVHRRNFDGIGRLTIHKLQFFHFVYRFGFLYGNEEIILLEIFPYKKRPERAATLTNNEQRTTNNE